MKKRLSKFFAIWAMFSMVGCFSVMRIPTKKSCTIIEDPVTHETYETNVVYGTVPGYPMCVYPTLHLRWHLLSYAWKPAPEGYQWRHVGGPIASVVSLIGLPGDLLVDTIFLPKDWDASETNKCALCNEVIHK